MVHVADATAQAVVDSGAVELVVEAVDDDRLDEWQVAALRGALARRVERQIAVALLPVADGPAGWFRKLGGQ